MSSGLLDSSAGKSNLPEWIMDSGSPFLAGASARTDIDVWEHVRRVLEDLLAEANEVLGRHLRHDGFAMRAPVVTAAGVCCEIAIGRSSIRLESRGSCAPASREEPALRAAFGPCTPLARIRVWRIRGRVRQLESTLAADPVSRRWMTTDPPFGPARLDDRPTLEAFLWTLLVDPP